MVESYKAKFIQFLFDQGALRIGGPFVLKSKRQSPYFINLGDVNAGSGLIQLGEAYASALLEHVGADRFDGIFGIPEKAKLFGGNIVAELARMGYDKSFSSYRKEAKTYGDATALGSAGKDQLQKEYLLGAKIPRGSRHVIVDDVMTAGDAKEEALQVLRLLTEDVVVQALMISANRQEMNEYGENAIEDFRTRHSIPVHAVITAGDIYDYAKETGKLSAEDEMAFLAYLRAWGTPEIREKYGLKSRRLIEGRAVIPACDTHDLNRFAEVVIQTAENDKIGGYKIGFELGLTYGLPAVVEVARKHAPEKKLIYDHQKGGTDIGDVEFGRKFARTVKNAGFDALILFPQSGPVTQTAWTGEALQAGLEIFIGGEMTHRGFLAKERGYIKDEAPEEIYRRAARHGVVNFIVPGNRPESITRYRQILHEEGVDPSFAAPGFITQRGVISDAGKAAGENFLAIVGRDIMNAENIREKAKELTSQL